MKQLFIPFLICACCLSTAAFGQQDNSTVGQDIKNSAHKVKHAAKKGAHVVKEDAKVVGNKTAEVASKGASKITDKTYKDKVGPNGETIYIDGHSKYYWVDDKGHKTYVSKMELRSK